MLEVVDLRESLVALVSVLQLLLEFISVVCVVIGLVKTLMVLVQLKSGRSARYCFGNWLATALEFQLAADILATTVDPDMDSLIKLAIIAVIRTFLMILDSIVDNRSL
ncbi:DUF1622 domain-containing protein [Acinetobacter indicus]|uniref:DUF1622 domain-containing protein n=1 Tax=Acinetobacter indicus TaxID=756892 RepID=UPI000CEB990D|nr:DUF1622 domain-containing protein [Acinetobacter indicus]